MSEKYVFYFPPHQDDEITNFGVSLMQDIDAGYHVVCVLCTDGGASSARRLIGNGESCLFHDGKHDFPLSVKEFSEARDREYYACCKAMGLSDECIRISSLRAHDSELKTDQAERIILDAIGDIPPEQVEVKTLAPVTITPQNPDHSATGNAALNLYRKGAFAKLTQFYESIFLDKTEKPQYPIERIIPTSDQKKRFLAAAACYGIWEPENGFYAIGFHSVKDEFDMIMSDPVSLVIKK